MRILHIDTGKEWRGGQRQTLLLHEGLIKKGIESYLAANTEGILIKRCSKNCIEYEFKGEINPKSIVNLLKIVDKVKPDIIHSHDAHSLTPAIFAKMLKKNFRLIHTRRVDFTIKKNLLSVFKYKNRYVDKIVAISYAIKDILVKDGISDDKINVIYSGVDFKNPDDYECPDDVRELLSEDHIVLGCVANFAGHKDHKTLLKAFDIVFQHHKNVKLLLVGDGPLFDETINFAKTLKSYPNMIFSGFQDDIYSYLKCMDVFLMTSKEEGLCTSIIDALNFEIPVVATKAGGITEIIKNEYNGLLCEIQNPKDIASKILSLIENKHLYRTIKSNTKKSALKFSSKNMVSKYITLYNKLMFET
ncbi:glycosyltransferase family 4 protein [Deferribacter abyssi]|uniref:glycosyltransferase family 4 protein n=1 Tax=Deferribacter abyssi TaxID=213806 RepID=UPI003C261EF4